jgi:hypothetical protein
MRDRHEPLMHDQRHRLIQRLRGWRQRPVLMWRDKTWSMIASVR